jgi:hypothetical protein
VIASLLLSAEVSIILLVTRNEYASLQFRISERINDCECGIQKRSISLHQPILASSDTPDWWCRRDIMTRVTYDSLAT